MDSSSLCVCTFYYEPCDLGAIDSSWDGHFRTAFKKSGTTHSHRSKGRISVFTCPGSNPRPSPAFSKFSRFFRFSELCALTRFQLARALLFACGYLLKLTPSSHDSNHSRVHQLVVASQCVSNIAIAYSNGRVEG